MRRRVALVIGQIIALVLTLPLAVLGAIVAANETRPTIGSSRSPR
jgi:hypothetical protein